MGKALEVVIFSRKGCHLCEEVEGEVRSVKGATVDLAVVDIDGDPSLQARYLTRVPVVMVGGREVFEARVMDPAGRWRERLARALA